MKKYRVKVTEKHSDYVWVEASSREEAKKAAVYESKCEYECVFDSEIVGEYEIDEDTPS